MAYTIDIYNHKIKPAKTLIDFANFIAFFPQLVAGPIEKAKNLLPQIENFRGSCSQRYFKNYYIIILWVSKESSIG